MRILFVRPPIPNVTGTRVYTLLLIKMLRKMNHIVGLLTAEWELYIDEFKAMGVKCFTSINKITSEKWDIVVFQNLSAFTMARDLLHQLKGIPSVFVGHSSSASDQIVPYPELFRMVIIAEGIAPAYNKWGIPSEIVEVVYNPVNLRFLPYTSNQSPPFRLLHVSRLAVDRADVIRQIISVANTLSDCHLTIVGGGPMEFMLRECANSNVSFVGEQLHPGSYFNDADLIIGSGRTAIEAMAVGRPFIVVGVRGFGGVVTPDNYSNFKKNMFAGRFGGSPNEPIPLDSLRKEIINVLKCQNIHHIIRENLELVKRDYEESVIAHKMVSLFQDVISLNESINDFDQLITLKPKFVSNCEIRKTLDSSDGYEIIRQHIGKILFTSNENTIHLLRLLDGSRSIIDLMKEIGYKGTDNLKTLAEYIKKLWEAKIVVFQNKMLDD